ncbi:unnamed protein product [Symbiodinium microadriaticum]|nr:unnamed protein product [Symbiodinium microadriaticum]
MKLACLLPRVWDCPAIRLLSIILRFEPGLTPTEQDAIFQRFDAARQQRLCFLVRVLEHNSRYLSLKVAAEYKQQASIGTGPNGSTALEESFIDFMVICYILGLLKSFAASLLESRAAVAGKPNLSGYEREAVLVRLGLDRGNAVDFLDFCRILGGDLSITIDPRASSLPEVPVGLASQELLRQVSSELQRNGALLEETFVCCNVWRQSKLGASGALRAAPPLGHKVRSKQTADVASNLEADHTQGNQNTAHSSRFTEA